MSLDRSTLERFRSSVEARLGLFFEEARLGVLADVLQRRADAVSLEPSSFLAGLEARGVDDEWRSFAADLVVSETYFLRAPDQLRAFVAFATERLRSRRTLRVLSAGCASGEEPYSLAILLREAVAEIDALDLVVRGIDLNAAGLVRARRGRYSAWSVRETPADLQTRWFREEGRELVLDERIRRMVQLEELNLAADDAALWRPGSWDVVFCRNVLMYFTPDAARRAVARIAGSLASGGLLFLGHAETLRGVSNDFQLVNAHGTFYYARKDAPHVPVIAGAVSARSAEPRPALEPADSWVDTIRQASERVHALTQQARDIDAAPGRAFDMAGAIELLRQERFSDAETLVRNAPASSEHDPDLLLLAAVLHTHGGNLREAERLSRDLLAHDDLNAGAHYLLALCREAAADREGAVDHGQTAAYLDPGFAMPRLHLGLLARRAGDAEGARRELRQALALLEREESSRLLLFGGGFGRESLLALCRAELVACGETA